MVTMDSRERDRDGDGEGCGGGGGGGGDDDILEEIIIMSPTESTSGGASLSSVSSYFSSPSDFNSPFGSEIGSTETESEDDDYIAELNQLTRWMAEYTFQEDDDDDAFLKSSPETAAPNNSQASGLSVKLLNSNFNSVNIWKEEFMKTTTTTTTEKANSDSWLSAMNNSNSEICSDKILSYEQTKRLEEVYQLNTQPETDKKQGFIDHGVKRMKEPRNMENHSGGKSWRKRILNPPHPHPHPHLHLHPHRHPSAAAAQNGSGMKAVFLGGSSNGKGSSGTGVFLPTGAYRRTAEPKKKKGGCSTVLIPARVLHTLQQHFNNVGAVSQSKGGDDDDASSKNTSPWQNDVLARINELLSQQKEKAEFRLRQQQQEALAKAKNIDEEILKLPKEWTY